MTWNKVHCFTSIILTAFLVGCERDDADPAGEVTMPVVETLTVTAVTETSATLNGRITDAGNGEISFHGFFWGREPHSWTPGQGSIDNHIPLGPAIPLTHENSEFKANITNLQDDTDYYVVAYAQNGSYSGHGQSIMFRTHKTYTPVKLELHSNVVSTFNTAILSARLTNVDQMAVSSTGFCWSEDPKLTNKQEISSSTDFKAEISGLKKNTRYYFMAYANTQTGFSYSDTLSFKTAVLQLENRFYHSVTISTREWLTENLHVTKFRNGDAIPNVKDTTEWANTANAAYCAYQNNEAIADTCGYLYNWYAVHDSRQLAPEGWHVPDNDEFWNLINDSGGRVYTTGLSILSPAGWTSLYGQIPHNRTGLTLIPGGLYAWSYYFGDWVFFHKGSGVFLWTSDGDESGGIYFYMTSLTPTMAGETFDPNYGLAIRLIKD